MNKEEVIRIVEDFWDEGKKVGIKKLQDDYSTTAYAINLFTYQDWERLVAKLEKCNLERGGVANE